jgi:dTDP-4-amino-4,6-dideoxygalactose transaminase
MSKIPLIDVKAQYAPLADELKARFAEVLESGQFILGPNVKAFESEAAAHLGVSQAIGVGNGTDAITLVLSALEIGPGDEVICPAFTFYATTEPIALLGATPVFADIERETMNLDPEDVARKITPRTKAIMPVHLFGRPAKVDELKAHGLPVIEDAAQAFGGGGVAQKGIAATFSFFPTKNLFCLGDGGLVASSDEELAARVRMLRFHGSRDKKLFEYVGYNSRLDEIQAAMLRVFLGQIKRWNELRREAAVRYAELGLGDLVELPKDEPGHVYHLFCVRSPERDKFRDALAAAGIGHACHYVVPLHLQPSMAHLGYKQGDLPETERAARENLCVPLWAGIAPEQQERVVATLQGAVATPVT